MDPLEPCVDGGVGRDETLDASESLAKAGRPHVRQLRAHQTRARATDWGWNGLALRLRAPTFVKLAAKPLDGLLYPSDSSIGMLHHCRARVVISQSQHELLEAI